MKLRYLVFAGLAVWAVLGSPINYAAGVFWPAKPAPWEAVDAYYYPDPSNLSVHKAALGVGSLDACRSWVRAMAAVNSDPGVTRGDYECGVGKLQMLGDMTVYRIT